MKLPCFFKDRFMIVRDEEHPSRAYYYPYVRVFIKDRITGLTIQTFGRDEEVAKEECRAFLMQYRHEYYKNIIRKMFCLK